MIGLNDQSDNPPTLLLRAKAFLGVLVLNSSANSITANSSYTNFYFERIQSFSLLLAAGITRPFLIFVTEEVFIGQLFDAYIFRMNSNKKKDFSLIFVFLFSGISQVGTISMRDNPDDEVFVAGIK